MNNTELKQYVELANSVLKDKVFHHETGNLAKGVLKLESQLKQQQQETERLKQKVIDIDGEKLVLMQENARLKDKLEQVSQDDWVSVDIKPATGNEINLKLKDGSIIKNAIPQHDGDYYWKTPTFGEVFICEFSVESWKPVDSK